MKKMIYIGEGHVSLSLNSTIQERGNLDITKVYSYPKYITVEVNDDLDSREAVEDG